MERKVRVDLPRLDTDLLERNRGRLVLIVNNSHTSPILGKVDSVVGKEVIMTDPVLLQPRRTIDEPPLILPLKSGWGLTKNYAQLYSGGDIQKALYAINEDNPPAHWEIFARELKKGRDYRTWQNGIGSPLVA